MFSVKLTAITIYINKNNFWEYFMNKDEYRIFGHTVSSTTRLLDPGDLHLLYPYSHTHTHRFRAFLRSQIVREEYTLVLAGLCVLMMARSEEK